MRTERYLDAHPDATFEEVEAACFPGEDGKLQLFAISPRHLEACATRTCQVLVEGDYSGVLRAGEHYIPIAKDLSNVEEVLDRLQSGDERERIVENAHRDIVESGRYTYRGLVEQVEGESGLAGARGPAPGAHARAREAAPRDRGGRPAIVAAGAGLGRERPGDAEDRDVGAPLALHRPRAGPARRRLLTTERPGRLLRTRRGTFGGSQLTSARATAQ